MLTATYNMSPNECNMPFNQNEVSQRIAVFESCQKPRGWHFGAKIHQFASVILNLKDGENASFADIAFFLKTHFRYHVSRQRLNRYYLRISELIDQNWTASAPCFPLPDYRKALTRIQALRTRHYWRLKSPLYGIAGYLRTLVEIYGYSYQEVATVLRDEEGMTYSRQAIFAFLKRLPKPKSQSRWGEVGI